MELTKSASEEKVETTDAEQEEEGLTLEHLSNVMTAKELQGKAEAYVSVSLM